MKSIVKIVSVVLVITSIFLTLSACGGVEDEIIGMWYDEDGDVLSVQKDGTYNFEGEYGSGTWKILDDNVTIEFTDFYGMTKNIEIIEDSLGVYIFYHQERLYKDSYPSEEEISKQEEEISKEKEKNATILDAFNGVSYEVGGISPYCKITINTQNCSEEVQNYVTFKTDKDFYSNGDNAIITATLSSSTEEVVYKLKSTTNEYNISGQAEYLTSLNGVDLTLLKSELNDFVTAQKGSATGTHYPFGHYSAYVITSLDAATNEDIAYLSSLKKIKQEIFNETGIFNSLSFLYSIKFTDRSDTHHNAYISITANNLVKNPDGSIRWGTEDLGDYDFICKSSDKSIEDCINTNIMCNSENYNISKIEIK